ncbi:MAG: hypothetical protein H7210_07620 [Pyrinomonadaceae bacterium]|nr:hypothetical protein [Phycisphaerales bacterium]
MYRSRHICAKALISCVGVMLGASQAQAFAFLAQNGGELLVSSFTPTRVDGFFDQFVFVLEGPFVFETVRLNFTVTLQDPDPDLFAATFAFSDPVGQAMTGTIDGVRFVDAAGDWSGSGAWVVTGGTGQYTSFTGGGSFTFAALPGDGAAFTSFEGDIVPQPTAAVVLLMGGSIAAVRRRR